MSKLLDIQSHLGHTISTNQLCPLPPSWSDCRGHRPSAVLCLIAHSTREPGKHFLLLTKRSHTVRTHKGQIGFPGGHREAQDKSPGDTALRETFEEIGLPRENIILQGSLPAISSLSGQAVIPIVATAVLDLDALVLSPDEVDHVLCPPLEGFVTGKELELGFKVFGIQRQTYIYRYEDHIVWGLTAQIIRSANFTEN